MNKLTFLLPLKDRPNYTRIWLKHNLRPEYDYFVADGSIGDEHEELFRNMILPNLTYVRFSKDLSIDCYVEKMVQAISRVQTKFVMTCDNDDFINFEGVFSCINALEEDSGAICAGGPIYGVMQNGISFPESCYSLPEKLQDAEGLHNLSGFNALVQFFKNYRYMWYSIFRTEVYKNIWQNIKQLQISNVFLLELLQGELTFCHGKYIQVKTSHYIRLLNPVTNCATEASQNQMHPMRKIFFDDTYRCQVIRMSEHVAKLVDVSLDELLSELTNYYISGNARIWWESHTPGNDQKRIPLCSKIYARLILYSKKFARLIWCRGKFPNFYPFESMIAFINTAQPKNKRSIFGRKCCMKNIK